MTQGLLIARMHNQRLSLHIALQQCMHRCARTYSFMPRQHGIKVPIAIACKAFKAVCHVLLMCQHVMKMQGSDTRAGELSTARARTRAASTGAIRSLLLAILASLCCSYCLRPAAAAGLIGACSAGSDSSLLCIPAMSVINMHSC